MIELFHQTLLLFLVFSINFYLIQAGIGDEDIRCLSNSCNDVKCTTEVPKKCNESDTKSGIYMLSPDICNCCDYCLPYIDEGDSCGVGDPSNAKHTAICGPGLSCQAPEGQSDGICKKMNTQCSKEQQSYDFRRQEGFLGSMEIRPNCDDDGFYSTYKCIPDQTCHCLDSNGRRIFGNANFNTLLNFMPCTCSRSISDAVELLGRDLKPHEHFRCTSDGNYDKIQCINEKCLCVDAEDGAPTYPNVDLVNLKDLSNLTLQCYDNGKFYKNCEEIYMEIHKEILAKKNESGYNLILGYVYPSCDLDGTFAAVQENKTHKFCVDTEGNNLLKNPVLKTDPLAENMNCYCVRANLMMSSREKAKCLENGNYNPIQCRRGICRCVDENGHQKCATTFSSCEEVEENQSNKLKCT